MTSGPDQNPTPAEAEHRSETSRELREANERLRQVVRGLEETTRAQQVYVELSREMLLARDEDTVVDLFARGVRSLFPGRPFLIRVVDPRSLEITSIRASGPGEPDDVGTIRIQARALERMGLPESLAASPRIQVEEKCAPVYPGMEEGLALPLVAGRQLVGLVNLEFPPDSPYRREQDGLRLRPLANQVSLALRNLKLLDETLLRHDYLERLVEGANALIVALDRSRQIRVFNRALEELTGYRKEEVLGTNFLQLLPAEERPRYLRVLINSLRGVPTSGFETRLRGRNGEEVRMAMSTASILLPSGEIDGVIAVGQDLTKMKNLEAQVIHAERLATLGQLAAGVVHELNNPLTSISVYGEYLQQKLAKEERDPADLEKAARIVEGASRIREFTRELTSYARPSGADLVQLQLNEVVRQAVSFCEHAVSASGAELSLDLDQGLPRIFGVPGQLQQVFTNLVTNACDAVQEAGGGRIEIRTDGRDDLVSVFVADDGVGLRDGDGERIFEPFFTTKPPGKGTGLGLPIVRSIVENHGGQVSARPGAERGAVFHVQLPVVRRASG